ncbi:MAG: methyltransferase [Spirochaetaceae bacterium 4572_59]|nr:MAG: methyltransferase [Spirochaetaceae bacterium 4572_59]
MTSRDLVKNTLEFNHKGRIPRHIWSLPWAEETYPGSIEKISKNYPDDITGAPSFISGPVNGFGSGDPFKIGTYIDEWNCVWENKHSGIIGEVKEAIVSDWSDSSRVNIPLKALDINKGQINDFCRSTEQFVLSGCCPRPFERLQFIRGTEQLYMDLAFEDQKMLGFLKEMHQFYIKEMTVWAETDVDALFMMDDWGAQRGLLINPEMWRKFFKPLYKDYVEIAHSHGKKIFMHSDGNILAIYPDLIELGIDGLNSQLSCMGIDNLAQFKGKITFWGEIDRQDLLVNGTEEEIRDAVINIKETLYENGGIIGQCEFGPGANPQGVNTVFKTWNELSE